jgi:hypothetical protein
VRLHALRALSLTYRQLPLGALLAQLLLHETLEGQQQLVALLQAAAADGSACAQAALRSKWVLQEGGGQKDREVCLMHAKQLLPSRMVLQLR